jgi:hypothetical protein
LTSSNLDWREELFQRRPDLVDKLVELEKTSPVPILYATIVVHDGMEHLEVQPAKKLDSEEARRFNECVAAALGGKIDCAIILPNVTPERRK